jgi:hypothetical protein
MTIPRCGRAHELSMQSSLCACVRAFSLHALWAPFMCMWRSPCCGQRLPPELRCKSSTYMLTELPFLWHDRHRDVAAPHTGTAPSPCSYHAGTGDGRTQCLVVRNLHQTIEYAYLHIMESCYGAVHPLQHARQRAAC